jgi:hypothetical protein
MKKIIIALCIGAALASCDNHSSDKFVGNYTNITTSDYCKRESINLVISKNNGGQKYSVQDIRNNKVLDNFTAELDGDTLIVDTGLAGKINLTLENNQITWKNINRSFSQDCILKKQ